MSYPKFSCPESKGIKMCYLLEIVGGRCMITYPLAQYKQVNLGGSLCYVLPYMPLIKGHKITAMATVVNKGEDGYCTFKVVDQLKRVYYQSTKYIPAGGEITFIDSFEVDDEVDILFVVEDDNGNVTDEYGPMFVRKPKPKIEKCVFFVNGSEYSPDTTVVTEGDAEIYASVTVKNLLPFKFKVAVQLWDWNTNSGLAWVVQDLPASSEQTITTSTSELGVGEHKVSTILYVYIDNKWVEVDRTDPIKITVKRGSIEFVKDGTYLVIGGKTAYPGSYSVNKGDEISLSYELYNDGYGDTKVTVRLVDDEGDVLFKDTVTIKNWEYLSRSGYFTAEKSATLHFEALVDSKKVDKIGDWILIVKETTQPSNPNPVISSVEYEIGGKTYVPPFTITVAKGTQVSCRVKIHNKGGKGTCFVRVVSKEDILASKSVQLDKNSDKDVELNFTVNSEMEVTVETGYGWKVTDKVGGAVFKLATKVAPPKETPSPPKEVPTPPPTPTGVPMELIVLGMCSLIAIAGMGVVVWASERR